MLVLKVLLGLASKQGDVTEAFVHANHPKDETVYMHMPQGFKLPGKVLKFVEEDPL